MSVKKQIPSMRDLYSFYQEIPEEFQDDNDVDSFLTNFYWTFFNPSI